MEVLRQPRPLVADSASPPKLAVATSKRRILSRGAASQPRPRAALWPVSRAKLSMYDYTVENYLCLHVVFNCVHKQSD